MDMASKAGICLAFGVCLGGFNTWQKVRTNRHMWSRRNSLTWLAAYLFRAETHPANLGPPGERCSFPVNFSNTRFWENIPDPTNRLPGLCTTQFLFPPANLNQILHPSWCPDLSWKWGGYCLSFRPLLCSLFLLLLNPFIHLCLLQNGGTHAGQGTCWVEGRQAGMLPFLLWDSSPERSRKPSLWEEYRQAHFIGIAFISRYPRFFSGYEIWKPHVHALADTYKGCVRGRERMRGREGAFWGGWSFPYMEKPFPFALTPGLF